MIFFQKTGSIKTQSHLTKFKNIHYILILYTFPYQLLYLLFLVMTDLQITPTAWG